jgi:hypothetical protein
VDSLDNLSAPLQLRSTGAPKESRVNAITADSDGRISACHSSSCAYRCCQFQQSNYIVLYPGEYESAKRQGESMAHLQIIEDDDHGGKRAVCKAGDTSNCDNGYKPLDCKSYPLFPLIDPSGNIRSLVKGTKCPLLEQHLIEHTRWVEETWKHLLARSSKIRKWLRSVRLIGYSLFEQTHDITMERS